MILGLKKLANDGQMVAYHTGQCLLKWWGGVTAIHISRLTIVDPFFVFYPAAGSSLHRVRRQEPVTPGTPVPVPISSDALNDKDLCEGRSPAEYFRLTADDDCRDVVRCSVQGLLALRCPAGLAFDIEKQTCDWKDHVKNCELKQREYHEQRTVCTSIL